jgi:hypothetical protein
MTRQRVALLPALLPFRGENIDDQVYFPAIDFFSAVK